MADTITHDLDYYLAEARRIRPDGSDEEIRDWAETAVRHQDKLAGASPQAFNDMVTWQAEIDRRAKLAPPLTPCPDWCADAGDGHTGRWMLDVDSTGRESFIRDHTLHINEDVWILQVEHSDGRLDAPVVVLGDGFAYKHLDASAARRLAAVLISAAHKLDQLR